MLKNNFFIITNIDGEGDSFNVMLTLNAGHRIFDGHFPGRPVVPGACLMQMVKEITETVLDTGLTLLRADHLKFIAVIDPTRKGILKMRLTCLKNEDGLVNVSASLAENEKVCFKFNGCFAGKE